MAELKRYTHFADLKLAAKSDKKSQNPDSRKVNELEKFFELLRSNIVTKKTS